MTPHPVSVMASGMGMPSIGIYSWELFSFYGVENIIRIGSAGSYSAQLDVLDVVLAKEAYSESSFAKTLSGYDKDTIIPSKSINDVIIQAAKDADIECKLARVHSSDVFYTKESWQDIHGWRLLPSSIMPMFLAKMQLVCLLSAIHS